LFGTGEHELVMRVVKTYQSVGQCQ